MPLTSHLKETKGTTCKGLVFRGRHSMYAAQDGIGERSTLHLLKKKSCPGCPYCSFLLDDMQERATDHSLILPEIEDKALYSVRVTNVSHDWETGQVDDWDVEVFKLPKEENA